MFTICLQHHLNKRKSKRQSKRQEDVTSTSSMLERTCQIRSDCEGRSAYTQNLTPSPLILHHSYTLKPKKVPHRPRRLPPCPTSLQSPILPNFNMPDDNQEWDRRTEGKNPKPLSPYPTKCPIGFEIGHFRLRCLRSLMATDDGSETFPDGYLQC